VSDILFNIVKRGKTTFPELAGSMGMVATNAAKAGLSIEELAGFYATLTRAGIQTQTATTGIRAVLAAFMSPAEGAKEAVKEFGFKLEMATIKSRGMVGILKLLAKVANENPDALAKMFPNVRAITALLPAAGNAEAFAADVRAMGASAGATEEAFEKMKDTISFAFGKIKQSVVVAMGEVGEGIMAGLKRADVDISTFTIGGGAKFQEMGQKIGKALANIIAWLDRNKASLMAGFSAIMSVVGAVGAFLAKYPALLGALIALKITGFLGLNTAIIATIAWIKTLYMTTIPKMWAALLKADLSMKALTARFLTFKLVAGGLALGAVVGMVMMAKAAFEKFRDAVREGSAALREMQKERTKMLQAKMKAALAMPEGEARGAAIDQAKESLEKELNNAKTQIKHAKEAIAKGKKDLRDAEEEGFSTARAKGKGVGESAAAGLRGFVGQFTDTAAMVAAKAVIEENEAFLISAEQKMAAAKLMAEETANILGTTLETDRFDRTTFAPGGVAPPPTVAPAAGGGAAAGGGGGGGGRVGAAADEIADAIAGAVSDQVGRQLEEDFGREGARAGQELAAFLDMKPTEDQILNFMSSMEGLTQQDIQSATAARQQWVEIGGQVTSANQKMVEDIAGAIQTNEANEAAARLRKAAAQQRVDLQEEQNRQGSLMRRMEAEKTHGNAETQQFLQASQDRLAKLSQDLAAGAISIAQYQQGLSNVNAGFGAGTRFANVLARASKQGASGIGQAAQSFKDLQAQLHAGTITQSQFSAGVRQLTADMQKATQAAQTQAAAERKRAQAMQQSAQPSGGGGGGGQQVDASKAHPLDVLFRDLNMAMSRLGALAPIGDKYARDVDSLRTRQRSRLRTQHEIVGIQQRIQHMRTAGMRQQLAWLRPRMPSVGRLEGDPGLVTQEGNVVIELPNVTRVNNEDIASLADRLDEERSRRGRSGIRGFGGSSPTFG